MTEFRWAKPEWHQSIGSTNVAASSDPRPGRVIVADHQSAGQGRRGRTWEAPPGTSLAITVVIAAPPQHERGWVPLIGGLAVTEALRRSSWPVAARLKWPNDVLIEESGHWHKVCGVLAQFHDDPHHGPVVVLGAGVNIDQTRDQLPTPQATSWRLARDGEPLPPQARAGLVQHFLDALAELLGDIGAAHQAYRDHCDTIGRRVRVELPAARSIVGTATAVEANGALVVQAGSVRQVLHAGDVVHLRPDSLG